MSNLIKTYGTLILASSGLLFVSLPAHSADAPAVTGSSIINCSGASLDPDYVQLVCLPLQKNADDLLNGKAKAAAPIIMTQQLDIDEYRAKGVGAIIKSSQEENNVNSGLGSGNQNKVEVPWSLSQ